MKGTLKLESTSDLYQKEEIIIHPNEGFDLGLMNTTNEVNIYPNANIETFNAEENQYIPGIVFLSNSCKHGKISFNKKFWKILGMPKKVKLFFDDNRLFISNN